LVKESSPPDPLSALRSGGTTEETERDRGLARAIDRVRGKYGPKSILPGGITQHPPR
jgi:hypothetical protein